MAKSPTLELRARSVGPWPMNTYALACPVTHQSVLIDPGADPDTLMELLEGTQPIAILTSALWMSCASAGVCRC